MLTFQPQLKPSSEWSV